MSAGHVAALAGLEPMTSVRLRALLELHGPEDAYAVVAGRARPAPPLAALFEREPALRARWAASAARRHPADEAERCRRLGVRVLLPGDPHFPPQLLDDPERPAALFVQGDPSVLDARRVGVVGTRRPTVAGRQVAVRFGRELAEAGVVVVSGLALGIDGEAHRGALSAGAAPPVAIVANGHDDPYPRRHARLWHDVAAAGAVIGEWPPGTRPEPFRFPQRNRIVAALSEVVCVVESRDTGGSLITATLAAERGVEVVAVPGPVDAPASAGTNALLRDGAAPATTTDDLLVALGLDRRRAGRRRVDPRPPPTGIERDIVERCRERPLTLDLLVGALDVGLAELALAVGRLERSGWVVETGGWFQTVEPWADERRTDRSVGP